MSQLVYKVFRYFRLEQKALVLLSLSVSLRRQPSFVPVNVVFLYLMSLVFITQ
jgi:hypothetical protein